MKVIARDGVWAPSYFKTAISHCIEADNLLGKVLATDELPKHVMIDERINEAGTIVIVFSAMCIEAYLNDYLAQKMGESMFYKHYERKSSAEKLILALGSENLQGKENVELEVKNLFIERNSLVHAKSHDISYESNVDERKIPTNDNEQDIIKTTYFQDYCIEYTKRANRAVCAVLLLGEYMQRKEPSFRTDVSLLGLNAIPRPSMEIIKKIENLCGTLGIGLP